ncbi:MAG TPA: Uma2 family endonuclease [Bacteroidetes bacterium]|nr:Uma2 family endonuclease [Bacteroidota bacterium]
MVATALKKELLTVEEYFEIEKDGDARHEFYHGEIFVMGNTTKNHNEIIDNIKTPLRKAFVPKGCKVYSESIRLQVAKGKFYTYPDIMLTCDKRDQEGNEYMVAYPVLIVEVLSKTTSGRDHDFKWKHYKKLPSLQYYMMVSQYSISVELFTRIEGKKFWHYQYFESMDDVIELKKLGFSIPVKSIYENIKILPENENGEIAG